jgi:maltose O-acetyltransferase
MLTLIMDDRFTEDARTHRQRMLDGNHYIAEADPTLMADLHRAAAACARFNALAVSMNSTMEAEHGARTSMLRGLFGRFGAGSFIRAPFHCDYGFNIFIGERVFANFGLVVLDVAKVIIGDDTLIGPNVQLLTATHPLEAEPRQAKWESSKPITIGTNVWLGGGVIVCPGVTIGDNTVVGAGAVVTRNLPANVLAVGNPAKVIRKL